MKRYLTAFMCVFWVMASMAVVAKEGRDNRNHYNDRGRNTEHRVIVSDQSRQRYDTKYYHRNSHNQHKYKHKYKHDRHNRHHHTSYRPQRYYSKHLSRLNRGRYSPCYKRSHRHYKSHYHGHDNRILYFIGGALVGSILNERYHQDYHY